MTAILYDHTDIYYSDSNVLPYELYVPNALTAFFVLSGYLMYKRSGFCLKNKIRSIMKGLLLPYLIFTIAMALPKSLANGLSFNIADMLINVLSGKASWFVAALFIAEMLFSIAIRLTKGRTLAQQPGLSLPLLCLMRAIRHSLGRQTTPFKPCSISASAMPIINTRRL